MSRGSAPLRGLALWQNVDDYSLLQRMKSATGGRALTPSKPVSFRTPMWGI